jgi:hypothetical protein
MARMAAVGLEGWRSFLLGDSEMQEMAFEEDVQMEEQGGEEGGGEGGAKWPSIGVQLSVFLVIRCD